MENSSPFLAQLGNSFLTNFKEVVKQSKITRDSPEPQDSTTIVSPSTSLELKHESEVERIPEPKMPAPAETPAQKQISTVMKSFLQVKAMYSTAASSKQDLAPGEPTASTPLFVPIKLIEQLKDSDATGSNERSSSMRDRKAYKHSQKFFIEELVLKTSQEESPVTIFIKEASAAKAKAKESENTQDPAIITGAKFEYELPLWVAPCHGRVYIFHFAKNFLLSHDPISEEAYKEIFKEYDANDRTNLEIEADQAFIRGEWDVIAEMQKPENRNAIIEHERQLQCTNSDNSPTSFVYEDYILPEKFTLRMIKCKPLAMLQHEISSHNREHDLPPKDEIRLDVDVFVSPDNELELNPFDIIKGRHTEVAIPLHPLWQNAADLELIRQGMEVITPTVFNTRRQWNNNLLVDSDLLCGAKSYDDPDWVNKIQHPKTEADLDARGCFLYMNPDNVEDLSLWLDNMVDLALQNPCRVDIHTEEFLSGQYPTTGLDRPFFPYPQELDAGDCYAAPQQSPNFDQIDYPEDQGFDLVQPHDDHMPWTAQDSSNSACSQYFSFLARQRKLLKEHKTLQRAEKKRALEEAMEYSPLPYKPTLPDPFHANPHSIIKPGLAMYVRPATFDDIDTLLSIHQHWATETTNTPHTPEEMATILNTTTDNTLPFFVACLNKSPRTKRQSHGTRMHKEQVIGLAYVLPWSALSPFRSTYETFIYTSPDPTHQNNAIATTLLDRLLTALDLDHIPQFPTKCYDNGLPARVFNPGGMRGSVPARKLLANIYYTDAEMEDMLWKRNWLKKWGWRENALMSDVGRAQDGRELHLLCMGYDVGWRRERGRERKEGLTWRVWGVEGEEASVEGDGKEDVEEE